MNKKIIIIVGIIIIVAVSSYVLIKDSTSTSSVGVDTADWKTYRYDQYGFQVSYPPDWTPHISSTFEEGALGFSSPKDVQGNSMSFGIQRYDINKDGFGYPPETSTAPNIVVSGIEAYKDKGYVRNPQGPSTQGIWLIKDNFVYNLTFQVFKTYNLPSEYKYEDIEPAIFTFKEEKIRDAFVLTFEFIE